MEAALVEFGYERPPWYRSFKERLAAQTGEARTLAQTATGVGLTDVEVHRLDVEAGLDQPSLAVEWRLNMPHSVGFVAGLTPDAQAALRSRALQALSDLPSAIPMLILRAHVP